MFNRPQRIYILGNIAGGKSNLARHLSEKLSLPLYSTDQYQYHTDLTVRSPSELTADINSFISQNSNWVIDGFGPYAKIFDLLKLADLIIFIDLPLWLHKYLLTQRTLFSLFLRRPELQNHQSEFKWPHIKKLYQVLLNVDRQMTPELRRILSKSEYTNKVKILRNFKEISKLSILLTDKK